MTRFCRKIVEWASDGRRHLRASFPLIKKFFDLSQPPAAKASQTFSNPIGGALIYTAINSDSTVRFVRDDPESVRVVAGRFRCSQSSTETTRRHWISTWICNPTQNLATSLRLCRGRLRLIGGHCRSSEIVSGMPKMGEKSCEQSFNLNFKDWDRDGCGDA